MEIFCLIFDIILSGSLQVDYPFISSIYLGTPLLRHLQKPLDPGINHYSDKISFIPLPWLLHVVIPTFSVRQNVTTTS